MIARLLDLSTLDRDKGEPIAEWFDLDETIDKIVEVLPAKARAANIEIRYRAWPGLSIHADRQYVERIVQNLVVNAIEHSKGTQIVVESRLDDGAVNGLQLVIADDGIGTDAKLTGTPVVYAADHEGVEQPGPVDSGRGLGLAIAQRLAILGGYEVPDIELAQSYPAAVLVIEDDPLVRVGLRAMLSALPIRAALAEDLGTAQEELKQNDIAVDLIIVDWHLGGGVTAADILPTILGTLQQPCPIILLSGEREKQINPNALASQLGGVSIRFLQKPISPGVLAQAMSQLTSP